MKEQAIKNKYFNLLAAYVTGPEESYLLEAADLGRELALSDVPPEEIAELHEQALERLAREQPDMTLLDAARRISSPLMELLMAYGLAFRERLETRRRAEEQVRQKTKDLALVNSLNSAVNRGDSMQEIIHLLSEETKKMLSSDGVTAYLVSGDKEYLVMQNLVIAPALVDRIERLIGIEIPAIKLPLKAGSLYLETLQTGKPLLINDPVTIQRLTAEFTEVVSLPATLRKTLRKHVPRILQVLGIQSVIIVPLLAEGEAIGLLDISSTEPLMESDLHRLEIISGQLTAIIKRKRAEEALRESEERFTRFMDHLPGVAFISDPGGFMVYGNQRIFEVYGLEPKEMIGRKFEDYLAPDMVARFAKQDQTVLLEERTLRIEETICDQSGPRQWLTYKFPVYRPGRPMLVGGVGIDITERVQAEEALRESEQKYRIILESIEDGYYEVDLAGDLAFFNDSLCKMLGYSPDELMGLNNQEFMDDETTRSVYQIFNEVYRTGKPAKAVGWELVRKDKDRRYIEASVSLMSDPTGEPVGFRGVARDITERKRAEREIEERQSYLESVLACAPDAIVTLDARRNILEWNSGAERLFGYTLQEVVGRNLDNLITGPDANVFEEATGLTRQILAGGNLPPTEMVRYRKDGSPVDVIGAGSPILIEDEVIGVVAVYTDITERKRVEKQLRQQERLAAVGQLAAGIAHDFNNTMASIILYAQMMLRASDLSSRDRERLGTINQEARHAADLTQQILDFSRRSVLERRPLDLLPFLKELAKLLESTLPENIKIVLAYGPDEYTVNADPTRVQQAMMNLALNARDAMLEGGELRIGLERIRIKDSQEAPLLEMEAGEWVQVTVVDTGTGIPPDVLPHMFEPFFTTKPVGQGTGLGLAQVYGIVKQHGGEIDVESELGHGATFVIYLPALPVSAPEVLPREIPALAEGHGETILVVEDNPGAREALSDTLEMLNYRVLAAANGQEALEIYRSAAAACSATASTSTASTRGRRGGERSRRIDLVLTDIVMPGMGGRELMRELRKIGPHLKGLVVTGYAVKEDLREEGIVDVLRKPFDVGALAEVVRHALDAD